jgi:hypothetical protein
MATVTGDIGASDLFVSSVTINNTNQGPGGADTQVNYNNAGVLDGDPNFTWTTGTKLLHIGYDASNHLVLGASSTGQVAWTATGTGAGVNFALTSGNFSVNTNDIFVTTATGLVGINTVVPATQFQVLGTTRLGDQATNYMAVSSTGELTFAGTAHLTSKFASVAIDTTLDASHQLVQVSVVAKVITLPTAVSIAGRQYSIDNIAPGSITVATTASQTINGSLTQILAQDNSMTVYSDGSNWRIL